MSKNKKLSLKDNNEVIDAFNLFDIDKDKRSEKKPTLLVKPKYTHFVKN